MKALLINPQMGYRDGMTSTWQTTEAKKAGYIPLGLLTAAAYLPEEWQLKVIDRNLSVECSDALKWADIIFIGGIAGQQIDANVAIKEAKELGKLVIVGGPDATERPLGYPAADHILLGEAEITLVDFLRDLGRNPTQRVYETKGRRTDITQTRLPRYDLINLSDYVMPSIQFSRGCPFICEFCTVILQDGRVPRVKTAIQIRRELEAIYSSGYRGIVEASDSNFYAIPLKSKENLKEVIRFQRENGYPFRFTTQLTANAADDREFLDLLRRAGFSTVLIGFESPKREVLQSMKKIQNLKRTINETTLRFHQSGVEVSAGFIIGNDGEGEGIAKSLVDAIQESGIVQFNLTLLSITGNAKLQNKLEDTGRTLPSSYESFFELAGGGLEFIPDRPRLEIYQDLKTILKSVYSASLYFSRVERLVLRMVFFPDEQLQTSFSKSLRFMPQKSLMKHKVLIKFLLLHPIYLFFFLVSFTRLCVRKPKALSLFVGRTYSLVHCYDAVHSRIRGIAKAKRMIKERQEFNVWKNSILLCPQSP